MIENLTLITGNLGKVEQFSRYLNHDLMHQKIDLDEIQSVNLEEVITHKVKQAFDLIKSPVLVDDTSLTIHSWGKLPGPFIKWFLQEIGAQGICQLTQGLATTAVVTIGLYDGSDIKVFSGEVQGTISDKPKGTNGFGWDKIFIPSGYNQTRGEMSEEQYDQTSPRNIALKKLEEYLKSVILVSE